MKGLRQGWESRVTTFGGVLVSYQYSSTFSSETAIGERFLILRTVTISLPTFADEICMN